ncbi:ABC transporter permease [Salinarimonas chemoclinalis]|uniref:ABC transporter permease n=1 Tax=Salinarimonas chemoclinalis TaxID=3241599 RepID=UPI003555CAF8
MIHDQKTLAAAGAPTVSRGLLGDMGRRLARDPITLVAGAVLVAIAVAALLAPWIAPADPNQTSIVNRLRPPGTPGHPLGTDELGRDLLSRVIWGGRLTLFMGFTPVVVATLVGGFLGILAGYAGGWVNSAIMRTMDVFYAFPSVLLAVAISGALGGGLMNGLLALTLVFIPPIARVAESVALQVRTQPYVEAAAATGASATRIVTGHVLKNVAGPILVYASSLISISIVIASGLSFLGLGVSPPDAEWGLMLSSLRQSVYVAPLNAVIPGAMIFLTSLCFNTMTDGLRHALNVKE